MLRGTERRLDWFGFLLDGDVMDRRQFIGSMAACIAAGIIPVDDLLANVDSRTLSVSDHAYPVNMQIEWNPGFIDLPRVVNGKGMIQRLQIGTMRVTYSDGTIRSEQVFSDDATMEEIARGFRYVLNQMSEFERNQIEPDFQQTAPVMVGP